MKPEAQQNDRTRRAKAFHEVALGYIHAAQAMIKAGKKDQQIRPVIRKAFNREWMAGMLLRHEHQMEPARSLILGTAAQLALDLGLTEKTDKAIAFALEGHPPPEMAEALKKLRLDHMKLQMEAKNSIGGIESNAQENQ